MRTTLKQLELKKNYLLRNNECDRFPTDLLMKPFLRDLVLCGKCTLTHSTHILAVPTYHDTLLMKFPEKGKVFYRYFEDAMHTMKVLKRIIVISNNIVIIIIYCNNVIILQDVKVMR